MAGDYEVGYGRPPKHSRFRKGRSGNSKGRPKGSRNQRTELLEELGEKIVVREGGQCKRVSKRRAVFKSLTARAMKGDAKATALLFDLDQQAEEREAYMRGVPAPGNDVFDARERFIAKIEGISRRLREHRAAESSNENESDDGDATGSE
jgi:hypothetical protein